MIGQADFSAGMVRSTARDLIPENGAFDIRGGLLDDDGNVYLRGPTARQTTTQAGTSLGAVWEGDVLTGRQMIAVGSAGLAARVGSGWSSALFSTAVASAGGGLAVVLAGQVMFVPLSNTSSGLPILYAWAGVAIAGGVVTTQTLNVTKGSTTVTLSSGSWPAYVVPGMFVQTSFPLSPGVGVVKSVDSGNQLTLTAPWGFATGASPTWSTVPVMPYPFNLNFGSPGYSAVTTCGGRVLVARGKQVLMSKPIDPATGTSRPFEFDATDFHEFPATVIALATLRDRVFVFTQAGIYVISNVALDIVDAFGNPQHRVEKVSGDVVLRSAGGVAPWRDSLVVAAVDGVYVMDASGRLDLVSRSISPFWQELMKAGYQVGQVATFRDHVWVPVGGQVLVGRLDRSVATASGRSAPWTRITDGEAASCTAFAVQDPYGSPKLVAGSNLSGYLLDLTGLYAGSALSAAASARDADNSPYTLYLETREFVIGGGFTPAYIDRLMLDYESSGGAVSVLVSKGKRAAPGSSPTFDALATAATGNYTSQAPRAIAVRKTSRRVSFAFGTTGSCSGLRLRGFTVSTRERGLQR